MGREYIAKCHKCQNHFKVKEGGGKNFYLLHCDVCGKEKIILTSDLLEHEIVKEEGLSMKEKAEKLAGSCENGHFRIHAKARCPKCLSDDYEIAVDDNGQVTMAFYD